MQCTTGTLDWKHKALTTLAQQAQSRDNLGGGWEKIARLTTSLPPLAWEAWYNLATAIARYKVANGLHPFVTPTPCLGSMANQGYKLLEITVG